MTFPFGILSFDTKPSQNKKTAKIKKDYFYALNQDIMNLFIFYLQHYFQCWTLLEQYPYCLYHPNGFQKRAFPNFVVDSNRRVYHPYRFVFYWPIWTDFFWHQHRRPWDCGRYHYRKFGILLAIWLISLKEIYSNFGMMSTKKTWNSFSGNSFIRLARKSLPSCIGHFLHHRLRWCLN